MVKVPGDHYTFWHTTLAGVQRNVKLRDQFHRQQPFEAYLWQVEYLGNPAWKTRGDVEEEVQEPRIHLLGYVIDPKFRPRGPKDPVIIRNQFTDDAGHKWLLGEAPLFLIPSWKWYRDDPVPEFPPPPIVDHFVCYEVIEGPTIEEQISLRDQFTAPFYTKKLTPKYLGVPADKNGEGIRHPEIHLAIYEIYPNLDPPAKPGFGALDQINRYELLNAQQLIWLGVPSFKEWNPDAK